MSSRIGGGQSAAAMGDPPLPRSLVCRYTYPIPTDYPSFHGALSRAHPDLRFTILARMVLDDSRVLEDLLIEGAHDRDALLDEIRRGKGVHAVEFMESEDGKFVFRVTQDMTPVSKTFRELEILVRYPISIEAGKARFVVVASRAKSQQLYQRLRKLVPATSIAILSHDELLSQQGILTARQKEVYRRALTLGYWDVPRRINQSDLARSLQVSKSTMSQTLAAIESKILHECWTADQ